MKWNPKRRLGRIEMDMIRQLFKDNLKNREKEDGIIQSISEKFGISWEAVKRILKSKWNPPPSKSSDSMEKESLFDRLQNSKISKQ